MQLKSIHTYQYVRFQGANENFISVDNPKFKGAQISLLTTSGVVDIKSDKDHILVFPTNIAYCVPLTSETVAKNESRGQLLDVNPGMQRK